ncbi:hypothetical protein C922_02525 [Plasmodium inui San Antonio 1]|uniref:Plasmodium RESA N-terminal domain-containing protein n=1 Tax=Plasmodium inui San Antonio 1 TaxID=1237626 RepID=W7ANM5_9APIC|nr:hypothetical protein C922_02525 [Plasmodium inui San Antonio 1]EUD66941.1 hypothetical protein C922_02525 [Plasmodium inui San Antonio 1]
MLYYLTWYRRKKFIGNCGLLDKSSAKIQLKQNQRVNNRGDSTDEGRTSGALPFGCKRWDLRKKLNKWQLENLLLSSGFILIKKKNAYIIYYYFNQYLKKILFDDEQTSSKFYRGSIKKWNVRRRTNDTFNRMLYGTYKGHGSNRTDF